MAIFSNLTLWYRNSTNPLPHSSSDNLEVELNLQPTQPEEITLQAIQNAQAEISDDQASTNVNEVALNGSEFSVDGEESGEEVTISPECKVISPSEGDSLVGFGWRRAAFRASNAM